MSFLSNYTVRVLPPVTIYFLIAFVGATLFVSCTRKSEVRDIPPLGILVDGDSLIVGKSKLEATYTVLRIQNANSYEEIYCSVIDSNRVILRDTMYYSRSIQYKAYRLYFEGASKLHMRLMTIMKSQPGRDEWGRPLSPLTIATYNAPRRPLIGYCLCHHE